MGFFAAIGEVAHVPTQWSEDVAAVARFGVMQRVNRDSRRENLTNFAVMSVLVAVGSKFHFTVVSWRSGLTYSGGDAGRLTILQRNELRIV
jgi:hypothetical protein